MKTKLIQTKDYLLLIDEEAEVCRGQHRFLNNEVELIHEGHNYPYKGNKVIAYYPLAKEAEEFDLPLLPNPFKEVDFDNKSELKTLLEKAEESNTCDLNEYALGLLAGYKAAQSKQFSLEDVKKAIEMAREYDFVQFTNGDTEYKYTEEEIIQSLSAQQLPKEFIPTLESKCWCLKPMSGGCFECSNILKTITNSEGKKMLTGKWVY